MVAGSPARCHAASSSRSAAVSRRIGNFPTSSSSGSMTGSSPDRMPLASMPRRTM